jgi:hypothetical protein
MESKKIISIINEIEERFPINEWKVGSFYIWPYIRFRLGAQFSKRNLSDTRLEKIVYRYISGFLRFLKLLLFSLQNSKKTSGSDFLFLENGVHVAKHGKNFFYTRTDPIREKLQDRGAKCQTYVFGYKFNAPSFFSTVHIQYVLDFLSLLKEDELSFDLNGYEEFLNYMRENGLYDKEFEKKNIVRSVKKLESYRKFFKKNLEKIKPKAVFLLCYFSTYGFGMIKACKELKIPVIDVQHGIQDDFHYGYGRFKNISMNSIDLLPDIFYVWGQEEKDVLEKWGKGKIKVFKGGNDYLNIWKESEDGFVKDTIKKIYTKYSLEKYSKIILFTVYPGAGHDDLIVKAIQNSPKDWCWLVRHHPKSNTKSENMKERIGKVNCRIIIDNIISLPIFALVKVADVHITERSSTVIEASNLGIHSVTTTKECEDLFKTQFDQKMVSFRDSVDGILQEIGRSKKEKPSIGEENEDINKLIETIDHIYAHHN